jgi:hypothetical protein
MASKKQSSAAPVKKQASPAPLTELTTMSPKDMKFAPYNPRVIKDEEYEKLKASIVKDGVVENLVWNKKTGHVVGGNQRLKAVIELGLESVPVIVVNLNLSREKSLNLRLNKISGDWDYTSLREVIASIDKEDIGMTGFDDGEISALLDTVVIPEAALHELVGTTVSTGQAQVEGMIIPPMPNSTDGVSYVVYLSFKTLEAANKWLRETVNDEEGIRAGKRTKVVVVG